MAKDLELGSLLDYYGGMLTEKQRDAMEQYYNDDLSLAEIADNLQISRQGVRDSIKRGESILRELEEKVGVVARSRALDQALERLEELIREVRFVNSAGYAYSAKIDAATAEMLQMLETLQGQET